MDLNSMFIGPIQFISTETSKVSTTSSETALKINSLYMPAHNWSSNANSKRSITQNYKSKSNMKTKSVKIYNSRSCTKSQNVSRYKKYQKSIENLSLSLVKNIFLI